jgi:hypothetical protein
MNERSYQNSQAEQRARWRRRDHANIEAMQNRIIQRVTEETGVMMSPKVRTFISALQSAHGGGEIIHEPFRRSHLTIAQYLQFTGTDVAKEARVRRLLQSLEDYQQQTGVMFIHVKRGGELVTAQDGTLRHTTTEYIDLLKPVADSAVMKARESELWKKNPGKAMDAQIEWATPQLVRFDPQAEAEKATMLLSDYAETQLGRLEKSAEKIAVNIEAKGGNGSVWMRRLAKELLQRAEKLNKLPADRVTNLLPSPVENPDNTEENISKLDVALIYAGRGWRAFPCEARGKRPLIKEWQKRATTNAEQIIEWWSRWPDANVAIATGESSGILAIDVDPRHGGDETLRELVEGHGELPDTRVAATGGGGFHSLFIYPIGSNIRNSAGKLGRGIDVRGEGGYIIAPPSVHDSGKVYEWLKALTLAPLPEWLFKRLTEEKPVPEASHAGEARSEAQSSAAMEGLIIEGQRNETLFRRVAAPLAGRGAGYAEIESAVIEANERHCSPTLDVSECRKIARSAHSLETRKHIGVGA